ncbi:hypothetical protein KY306_02915 [Candidatus Woesearchaeota archaeon]|nr:hypothetical protein [Candidatus Woesearchaeota archaeon]
MIRKEVRMAKLSKADRKKLAALEAEKRKVTGQGGGSFSKLAETEKKMAREREKAAKAEEAAAEEKEVEEKKEEETAEEEKKAAEEEERASEAKESYFKKLVKGNKEEGAPGMGLFVIFIILGIIDIIIKRVIGYEPRASLLISIVLGLIFFFAGYKIDEDKKIKKYEILVLAAFLIDVFGAQLPLHYFPISGLREFLVGVKVFVWLILALILFVMGFIENLRSKQGAPTYAWVVIVLLIGVGIFFMYPQLMKVYEVQKDAHLAEFAPVEEQLEKIGEVFKAQVPAWKSAYYGIACTLSDPMGREQCVKQKEAEAKCAPYQKAGQLAEFEDCKNVELGIKTEATGAIDPAQKEPLKLVWEASQELKQTEMRVSGTPTFRAILKIENPRAAELNLEIECLFTDTTNRRNFSGLISPRDKLTVKDKIKEESLICTPTELLQNSTRYQVIFKVRLLDFTTESKLQILFFGRAETDIEKKEIQSIKSGYPLATGNSRAANDLARLNFNFFEGKQGYIAGGETIQLNTKIENIGKGQIIGVKRAEIDLVPNGLTSDDLMVGQPCGLIGDANTLSFPPQLILYQQSQKEIFGEVCVLRLSDYLKGLGQPDKESFKAAEFKGYLTYSYEVKGEFAVPKIIQI